MRIKLRLVAVLQEAELENFLFAGNANDITGFGREEEEQNERSALADLIAKVREMAGSLLGHSAGFRDGSANVLFAQSPQARMLFKLAFCCCCGTSNCRMHRRIQHNKETQKSSRSLSGRTGEQEMLHLQRACPQRTKNP